MDENVEKSIEKESGMDKKSKVLLWVIILAIFISVSITFYKTIILQDFIVINTGEE